MPASRAEEVLKRQGRAVYPNFQQRAAEELKGEGQALYLLVPARFQRDSDALYTLTACRKSLLSTAYRLPPEEEKLFQKNFLDLSMEGGALRQKY